MPHYNDMGTKLANLSIVRPLPYPRSHKATLLELNNNHRLPDTLVPKHRSFHLSA